MTNRILQMGALLVLVTIAACSQEAAQDAEPVVDTIPGELDFLRPYKVHVDPARVDEWMVSVDKPEAEARRELESEMNSDGGWTAPTSSTYVKRMDGYSINLSVLPGKLRDDGQYVDQSAAAGWTTLYIRYSGKRPN